MAAMVLSSPDALLSVESSVVCLEKAVASLMESNRENSNSEEALAEKAGITDIPGDNVRKILVHLRAVDIANAQIASRIFNSDKVSEAIRLISKERFVGQKQKSAAKSTKYNAENLRFLELQHIANIINSPEPVRGCLISKSWIKNFMKYSETIKPGKKALSKRKSRMLERKYSDVLPPWPEVNYEITCEHGNLSLSRGSPSKGGGTSPVKSAGAPRRRIETRLFRQLQCYYPGAKLLKAKWGECTQCQGVLDKQKKELEVVKEGRSQELEDAPALRELFARKTGVPKHYLVRDSFPGGCPLTGGIYCLVPRSWLQAWRSYIKDPKVQRPRIPETSMLLCEGHGKLLTPPHVIEFLRGERRKLLGDLDEFSGCVCEIVTTEEWDKLTEQFRCDFAVRFFVDPTNSSISWGVEQCYKCDPCYLGVYYMNETARKLSH